MSNKTVTKNILQQIKNESSSKNSSGSDGNTDNSPSLSTFKNLVNHGMSGYHDWSMKKPIN